MNKNYGLALGWWAARWLAHIWVLKYIHEKKIDITEVSWTSMWAVVAWFYAIWKSVEEMEEFAKSINYLSMWDPDFRTGLLKWLKIEKKLKEIFWDSNIEDTKIPLKIVATNLETGEVRVFEKWLIVDAIRASISLPGIFIPKEIEWEMYIDGWIMMSLPIEVLSNKNVIAISALKINKWPIVKHNTFLWMNFKTGFWKNNFEIIKRSAILMRKSNEDSSLRTKWKEILFIRPDFKNLDIADFNKVDEFVDLWYRETKTNILV